PRGPAPAGGGRKHGRDGHPAPLPPPAGAGQGVTLCPTGLRPWLPSAARRSGLGRRRPRPLELAPSVGVSIIVILNGGGKCWLTSERASVSWCKERLRETGRMKTVTDSDLARNLTSVLDGLERGGEEVVILRNNRPIGRLVPEPRGMTVREAFGDLCGILTDEEGEALLRDIEQMDRILDQGVRDPWES
ncbi:MAG: type II toxin-antitoxin system Phd/YefM family antitoxin, partial [Planctomycetes bacterium]|nr:type II toxin-antitoxin system Phd/YefM family antitoxin [Planctomycetota bacterium]